MPLPDLAAVGNRFSLILHHLIFSFPSPNGTRTVSDVPDPAPGEDTASMSGFDDMVNEPGEPKALAGGVGPLSFAGSGYGITLVLMAILLNRIHHIVRRPRPPAQPLPHPPVHSLYHRARLNVSRALTSPSTPRYLRVPGLIALVRAWVLFSILTLQVANLWPVDSSFLLSSSFGRTVNRFGQWAGGMEMSKVSWQVFLSVCNALVCSGLANGLDRTRNRDIGAGFNLFGYSFLLHLYSSPLTHHRPPPAATQGRPDIHALFQLWLSLTELTWLQAAEMSPITRRNQLLPTAICGSMGLVHFVSVVLTSPLKFPSFTFMTHLMALFLSIIITLSVVLKAFTHIFTLGYLPSPILQNLLPHDGVVPVLEDDFGVALLKLGTACIEATQYSGLQNELISIEERKGPWVELSAGSSDVVQTRGNIAGGFGTEITNIEVAEIEERRVESTYWKEWRGFWYACGVSLESIAYHAIMATPVGRKMVELSVRGWWRRWWYGPRHWRFWRRAAWREPLRLQLRRGVLRTVREARRESSVPLESSGTSSAVQTRPMMPDDVQWRQVLRGDVDVEDDEEDWIDDASSSSSSSSSSASQDEEHNLYRDLVPKADELEDDLQPVLLAHLTNTATPLTRRRYAAILSPQSRSSTPSALTDVVADRRALMTTTERDEWDDDRRRCCVVCTIEPRDTILWPCRCLALCNGCRESLAARLSAKEHMCPCCRKKVEGYSRIYIP